MSGYCATERTKTAILPASVMMTEMTAAKIGRLMKNLVTLFRTPARQGALEFDQQAWSRGESSGGGFSPLAYERSSATSPERPRLRPFGQVAPAAVPSRSRAR